MRSNRLKAIILIGLLLYLVVGTVVTHRLVYSGLQEQGGLFVMRFGFGPLVEQLVIHGDYAAPARGFYFGDPPAEETYMMHGHRMPVVPLFLAAVGKVWNNILFAMLIKNALIGLLIGAACLRVLGAFTNLTKRHLLAATAFCASFPILLLFAVQIDVEEGYTIGYLFFLFAALLTCNPRFWSGAGRPPGKFMWAFLVLLNTLLVLTKASMWPLAVMNCVFFAWLTRRWTIGIGFAAFLIAGFMAWGAHNYAHSGEFRLGSSWSGWCFYKGNCEHTDDLYPQWSIDEMDHRGLIKPPIDFEDEWSYEHYNKEQAKTFIKENPQIWLKLFLEKTFVHFVEVRNMPDQPAGNSSRLKSILEWTNRAYMTVYRIMLGAILAVIAAAWFARLRGRASDAQRRITETGLVYFLFISAYACPYLLGFGYQRHIVPMILPTVVMGLYLLNEFRAGSESPSQY